MAEIGNPFQKTQGIADLLKKQGVFQPTALTQEDILKQRELVSGLPGLEPSDYSKQLKDFQDNTKLMLALRLAERGFASASATPDPGVSPFSTVAKELLSPLAKDVGQVSANMLQQRQALQAAEKADKARLSQAALTMTQQLLGKEDAATDKRFSLARSLGERNYTPTKGLQRTVDGKTSDFLGFIYTDKLTNLPKYAAVKKDGTLEEVPSEQLSEFRKPAAVTATKATGATLIDRVANFPVYSPDGTVREFRSVNLKQVRQIIPTPGDPRVEFGAELLPLGSERPMKIKVPDGKGGFTLRNPMEGVDFVGTDKDSYDAPKKTKYYIRGDLNETDFATARNLLGSQDLKRGEGVSRWLFTHKVDPQLSKEWYDVKGGVANLNPDQANKFLQTEKPVIKEPFEPKPFGTTSKEITVRDKNGEDKTIQTILMQTGPDEFRLKEVGKGKKFLDDAYQEQYWESGADDKDYRIVRPVLNEAFKAAVKRQSGNLGSDVVNKIGEQVLTQPELKRLVKLTGSERAEAINSIINSRVRSLTKETPEETVTLPESVLELDPRVKSLVEVPSGANPNTNPVVNPRILQPWTRAGSNIQLGSGSHEGFSQKITSKDVTDSRKNYPAIKQGFDAVYGGTKSLGDNVERILLFSGLWKNLPGVAKGMGAREFSESEFRKTFDEAAVKYNKAAEEYKPAAALDVGKGNQSKNLQAALDDQTDALRDNAIMLRFKDQGGAFSLTGTWLAEMRGSGFGELFEAWSEIDGTASKETYATMPSNKWADISKPDNQLNAEDLALKKRAFQYLQDASSKAGKRTDIGLTEFERAAEYLGALSRYKIRAFSMIKDSRPSDKDIEILLKAFVGDRDSDTVTFAKLSELQNKHALSIERNINTGIKMKAVFDPVFLATLDHTSRLLKRSSVRDLNPKKGGRAPETARLFRQSSERIRKAAESASGRIIPGNRSGAISPMSGNVDEESTANLYRNVLSAAKKVYPDKTDQEAVQEFVRQGLHLASFAGVYGTDRTGPPLVRERDGSFTFSTK